MLQCTMQSFAFVQCTVAFFLAYHGSAIDYTAITMCAITAMFSNDFSDEKETVVVLELPHITEKKWWCYFYVNLRLPFL